MNLPGGLEFLRPAWLLALLALPVLFLLARRTVQAAQAWRRAVDPHLLPHLLDPGGSQRGRGGAWLPALAYVLAVVALAGPSWREVEQPLWQSRLPTVIAADLSTASLATDMPPSRIAQLRARIAAQLQRHDGGPLGLVAFAGDAFTVAPLTEDVANIALFVDALQPDIMPADGQAADRAIRWSSELMRRAGFARGHIVLLTDHASPAAQRAAAEARAAGYTVSVVGLGSASGSEVRLASGASARVALDAASLRALAQAGGGRYAPLAADGADAAAFAPPREAAVTDGRGSARVRQDGGFWLVPPLMLVLLVAWMRRSAGMVVVLMAAALLPMQARAAEVWRRDDQASHARILQGVEAYRRGDYERAAAQFARAEGAVAHYNRGNALAKAGRLQDAVSAYDEALRQTPGMPDAVANRATVLAALQRKGGGRDEGRDDQRGGASNRGDPNASKRPKNDGDGRDSGGQGRQAAPPRDPAEQARADAAQRERMRRAMQQARQPSSPDTAGKSAEAAPQTPQQRERRLSNEAALRRVPDEPGSLLREKFRLEHERRQRGGGRQ